MENSWIVTNVLPSDIGPSTVHLAKCDRGEVFLAQVWSGASPTSGSGERVIGLFSAVPFSSLPHFGADYPCITLFTLQSPVAVGFWNGSHGSSTQVAIPVIGIADNGSVAGISQIAVVSANNLRQSTCVQVAVAKQLPFYLRSMFLREDELVSVVQRSMAAAPQTWEDREVLEWFGDMYWPVVQRTVQSMSKCQEELLDLGQEAWISVTRALPRLRFKGIRGSLAQWISGVAYRAVQHVRDRRLRIDVPAHENIAAYADSLVSSDQTPDDTCLLHELRELVRLLLQKLSSRLSPENGEMFSRHYVDGQCFDELAASNNVTLRAVESRCWRAMEKCRAIAKESELNDWQ